MFCPCHSNLPYSSCCKPFHNNKLLPKTALELMRSRYSAYALTLIPYLNDTSLHKTNPKEIEQFCLNSSFTGLEILEHIDGEEEAYVTFIARLMQNKTDVSFQEKSRFIKVNGRWIYESGNIGKAMEGV